MLSFFNKYNKNYFSSQNGEEGLCFEIIKRLQLDGGRAVEIGGHDGSYCSNTALLLREYGWHGLFVEADYNLYLECKRNYADNPRVRSQCCKVDEKNINAFVKDDCDLLSIDTDGMDFRIFEGLQAKPKIVIVEIDSSIPPQVEGRNKDGAAGYTETLKLGISKGYFLLVHCGNLIFVDNQYRDLFPEIEGDGLSNWKLYFNNSWVMEGVA